MQEGSRSRRHELLQPYLKLLNSMPDCKSCNAIGSVKEFAIQCNLVTFTTVINRCNLMKCQVLFQNFQHFLTYLPVYLHRFQNLKSEAFTLKLPTAHKFGIGRIMIVTLIGRWDWTKFSISYVPWKVHLYICSLYIAFAKRLITKK